MPRTTRSVKNIRHTRTLGDSLPSSSQECLEKAFELRKEADSEFRKGNVESAQAKYLEEIIVLKHGYKLPSKRLSYEEKTEFSVAMSTVEAKLDDLNEYSRTKKRRSIVHDVKPKMKIQKPKKEKSPPFMFFVIIAVLLGLVWQLVPDSSSDASVVNMEVLASAQFAEGQVIANYVLHRELAVRISSGSMPVGFVFAGRNLNMLDSATKNMNDALNSATDSRPWLLVQSTASSFIKDMCNYLISSRDKVSEDSDKYVWNRNLIFAVTVNEDTLFSQVRVLEAVLDDTSPVIRCGPTTIIPSNSIIVVQTSIGSSEAHTLAPLNTLTRGSEIIAAGRKLQNSIKKSCKQYQWSDRFLQKTLIVPFV